MSSDSMSSDENKSASDAPAPAPPKPSPPRRRRRAWSPWIIAACVIIIIAARSTASETDFQMTNLATYFFSFVAIITGLVWFTGRGPGSKRLRLTVVGGVLAMPIVFLVLFRVEGVSGELVPTFRARWLPPLDATLGKLDTAAKASVDLSESEDAFPGFLGPQRTNRLEKVTLARDWQKQPPRLVWRRPIGAGWSGLAATNGFAVTMEQRGPEQLVTCYDVATGDPMWANAIKGRHETKLGGIGPRSTPTIHEGRVYALHATGVLLCLDGKDGAVIWLENILGRYGVTPKEDMQVVGWGRSGSPLIVDDLVVVPFGGPADGKKFSLAAYNKDTGDLVWKGGDRQVGFSSPVVATLAGQRQILSVNENNVSGHDIESGEVLWEYEWFGESNGRASASQPVALPGNHVLLSKAYGGGGILLSVERADDDWVVNEVWAENRILKTKFTNVTTFDDYVFGLSDGILECVEWKSGAKKWKTGRARFGQGQVLGLSDTILVQAHDGYVVHVEATSDGFKELGRLNALSSQTWNNLCLHGKYLLVRNAKEAACYELP